MATEQSFAAVDTFDATFGKTYGPFFGGGAQLVVNDRFFAEIAISRFQETGSRAFINAGQAFNLGIPLTATITPIELTGGYRFRLRSLPKVRPYVAGGIRVLRVSGDVPVRRRRGRRRHQTCRVPAEWRRGVSPAAAGRPRDRRAVQPHSRHSRQRRRISAGGGERPRRGGGAVQAGGGALIRLRGCAASAWPRAGRIIDGDDTKRQRSSLAAPGAARDGDLCPLPGRLALRAPRFVVRAEDAAALHVLHLHAARLGYPRRRFSRRRTAR